MLFPEELRVVDSLRVYSDLDDVSWASVRKEVTMHGLQKASQTARLQIASAMLKARDDVAKGDFVGHPFRGNQYADSSGASTGLAGSQRQRSAAAGRARHAAGTETSDDERARSLAYQAKQKLTQNQTAKLGALAAQIKGRGKPTKVSSVREALRLIKQGKYVELADGSKLNTLLKELHREALKAKDAGEDFKIDLCNVTVAGTNLFCGSSLTDTDGSPLPRSKMPQLSGDAVKGSAAEADADEKGRTDAGPAFLKFLAKAGIKTSTENVLSASLRASQAQLIGPKVAGIMAKGIKKISQGDIYVSSDNFVIDGHHRWAAAVGLDAEDGLGDMKMRVIRIDMPISEVLNVANKFTDEYGIKRQSA